MTNDEWWAKIEKTYLHQNAKWILTDALRAVVELHKPVTHALPDETCLACQDFYPCPTIQAIDKELA